jgi:predicted negative regulator of RcsB-dependent stress response
MSLKENIDYVKDELNSEEKFLEGSIKVERFYKKYKVIIIGAVVLIVTAIVGIYITKNIQEQNKIEANIAFNKILENPENSAAIAILKEKNIQLFQIASYLKASKEGKTSDIQVKYLKELSDYKKALNTQDINKLNAISMQNDFLLKEFAIFNKALLQVNEGKFKDAKATLKLIPNNSKVIDLVNVLNHYLVTK